MHKKIYLLLFILLSNFALKAQQIPNGNFELWDINVANLSYEPVGWHTQNLGLYGDTGVQRYKPAHGGNLACGLKTSFILGTYALPGVLFTSFATSAVPDKMVGYIKGNLALDDTTVIIVQFSRDSTVIANGLYYMTQSQNNYIKFVMPIDFFGTGSPDSCRILVIGGGYQIDDTLTSVAIDDLSFEYPSNIKKTIYSTTDNLKLYPNPATDVLNIVCNESFHTIVIYNITGQLVGTYEASTSVVINDFDKGLYFLQLLDENKKVVAKKSFIKD